MTNVLVVAADNDLGRRVQTLPEHRVLTLSRSRADEEGLSSLSRIDPNDLPDVILFGEPLTLDQVWAMAQMVDSAYPQIATILVARTDTQLVLNAMRSGIRDLLDPDAQAPEIHELLVRVSDSAGRRQTAHAAGAGERAQSHVVVVASPKGGVGKTTLSTNLSVGLGAVAPMGVVLVDLDLQFGDVSSVLDLKPTHTLADAFGPADVRDTLMLKTFLTAHPSGFYALCGAESPEANEKVTGAQIKQLLTLLATQFRFVVVDTAAGLDDSTLAALEVATDLVLVSTMDVSCVRAVSKAAALLSRLKLMPPLRHFVLNVADRQSGMTVRDVEGVVGLPVNIVVPRSQEVPIAGNRGVPILLNKRNGPVQKAIRSLANRLADAPKEATKRAHLGVDFK